MPRGHTPQFPIPVSTDLRRTDFELAVSIGLVEGWEMWQKWGRNEDIDSGPEDVIGGGGTYAGFPTGSAETLEILSSSTDDTGQGAGGTGARTVTITNLLDENYNEMPNVTVTLDGTTPVSLGAQTYFRCSRMIVETAGSGATNAGIITLRHTTTTANIFGTIPAGLGQTQLGVYTVPAGKTLIVKDFNISMSRLNGSPGSANVTLRVRELGGIFRAVRNEDITNALQFQSNGLFQIPEKADAKITVESVSDVNTAVSTQGIGYLVDNNYI
jgi:hypothetical protein